MSAYSRFPTWLQWLIALIIGFALAAISVLAGPKQMVVCTEARWPNSAFGDMFGHTDAETFTGCDVPTLGTWVIAIVSLLAPLIALTIRSRCWR